MELKGIVVPVITPVDVDGHVDERAYLQLLDRLIASGVHGLFVGGTAGLGPLLDAREYERMLAVAMETVAGRVPLLAGVLEASMPRALERLHIVQALGYKAFVLTPTYYIRPRDDRELLAYFGRLRDASDLEMVIYNIPACTGSVVGPDVVLDMCRRGWIRYAKDSSGDAVAFGRLCQEGADIGLRMFQGLRPDFASLVDQGAAGCVPVPGNVIPAPLVRAWHEAESGNRSGLASLQSRLNDWWSALVDSTDFLSGSVYALSRLGIGDGHMLAPLEPAGSERQSTIDALLAQETNISIPNS